MRSSRHAPPTAEVPAVTMNGDFPHPPRAPAASASKLNSNHATSQSHTYQQNNIVQHNGIYHQFSTAQPPFQPLSTGLRHETPRALTVPRQHDQLLDLVATHNIQHVTEIARVDHMHRDLAREVHFLHSAHQNDLQILQQQLLNLTSDRASSTPVQKQIESRDADEVKAAEEYIHYHTSPCGGPSTKMLTKHSKEEVFKSYHDEADKREISAMKFREKAFELYPDRKQTPSSPLQIEPAPATAQQSTVTDFACCSTVFSAIGELVEHVERAHTAPEFRLRKRSRSKPVEIKTSPEAQVPSAIGHSFLPLTEKKVIETSSKTVKQEVSPWMPVAVRSMPPVQVTIPKDAETFSFEFLRTTFLGELWSPGYYFVTNKETLPSQSYWILDITNEPFLPQKPGEHGAKLTAFFNESVGCEGKFPGPEHYLDVPVFVKTANKDEYSYFGNYSQFRFSDKVGYDTIAEHIPGSVLGFHAEQLAEIGRPAWVTQALKEHFWPMPKYDGPIPTDSALNTPATTTRSDHESSSGRERRVMRALGEYADELKDWDRDANLRVNLLTAESILKAFSAADTDAEPGLRLFFEYLQCVGWDARFHQMLVNLKDNPVTRLEIGAAGKKRRPSVDRRDGSTAAKKGLSGEATFKLTNGKGKAREVVAEYPGPEAKTNFVQPNFNSPPVTSRDAKKAEASNGCIELEASKSTTKPNCVPPAGPKGDLGAAKKFASVRKTDSYVAPHLRVGK